MIEQHQAAGGAPHPLYFTNTWTRRMVNIFFMAFVTITGEKIWFIRYIETVDIARRRRELA